MASVMRMLGYSRACSECHNLRGVTLGLPALVSRKGQVCMPVEQARGMAGHSKWANIRHIKGLKDEAKSKTFRKITNMLRVAVADGGSPDPKLNSKLARVIEFANSSNMPATTVTNVLLNIQKAQKNAQSGMIELQAAGGVCLLVEVLTDNFTKTRITVKSVIKKSHLQEARSSIRYQFEEKGVVVTEMNTTLEEALDSAITLGAEDVVEDADSLVFTCSPNDMLQLRKGLEDLKYTITYDSIDFIPKHPASISEEEESLLSTWVQKLENMEEVMKVHVNL